MKLKRGETVGNVIKIAKQKSWVDKMTYGELLNERRFMREEKKRCNAALRVAYKIDVRGMWQERHDVWKTLEEMVEGCDWAIALVEKEMIKRGVDCKGEDK